MASAPVISSPGSIFKTCESTFALVRVGSSTHFHASCCVVSDQNLEDELSFWQRL